MQSACSPGGWTAFTTVSTLRPGERHLGCQRQAAVQYDVQPAFSGTRAPSPEVLLQALPLALPFPLFLFILLLLLVLLAILCLQC